MLRKFCSIFSNLFFEYSTVPITKFGYNISNSPPTGNVIKYKLDLSEGFIENTNKSIRNDKFKVNYT